ncbi:MAG TPA: CRISPR-associated endoribonuclease Cas6 [Bacteroidales bacterium]|nr:CRISPR-associated endoribonuclease Cas6 [Bacteroidales bacterium]
MRFKLTLGVNKRAFGNVLPINYQYEQSAVIYRILSQASKEYADWLHENGFRIESGKNFKLFTYSPLKITKRFIPKDNDRIHILSDTVEWQISFLPEQSTEKFIQGLFANQVFEIGDKQSTVQFQVEQVEVLPAPVFTETMDFETMSPLCLRVKREDGGTEYISPKDTRAKESVLSGLLSRYESFYGKPFPSAFDFKFKAADNIHSKKITIKANTPAQTEVRGYKCSFTLKAPVELMKIMYESGIGQECSQGFGCVRERKE